MKKLLSIAAIASAFVAFGEGTQIVVGTNGVTAIDSGTADTIVAISYDNLVGTAGEMIISNLVKTTNLTKGDELIAYNGGTYETWVLTGEGDDPPYYWQKNTTQYTLSSSGLTSKAGNDASVVSQAWGTGIWLRRQNYSSSFYIYGKPNSATEYTCQEGMTLVGNPTQTAASPTVTDPTDGDIVSVPAKNALGKTDYRRVNGFWKYVDSTSHKPVTADSLPEIPAGTGFWYYAKGSNTKISW